MKESVTTIIGIKNCRYTYDGENIAGFRRAKLTAIAKAIGVENPSDIKNDLLHQMLKRLDTMQADPELKDWLGSMKSKTKKRRR